MKFLAQYCINRDGFAIRAQGYKDLFVGSEHARVIKPKDGHAEVSEDEWIELLTHAEPLNG